MKRLIFVAALTAAALLPITSTAQQAAVSQEIFFRLQNEWAQARIHADIGFLERFYARKFTVGLLNGGEASRSEDLIVLKGALASSANNRLSFRTWR